MSLAVAHARLAAACNDRSWRDDPEDPDRPETIQAMQIVLNLPKQDTPTRTEVLGVVRPSHSQGGPPRPQQGMARRAEPARRHSR